MTKEELFSILGEVDERKVAAAGMAMAAQKKRRPVWVKWGALAACPAILCVVVIALLSGRFQQPWAGPVENPSSLTGPGKEMAQPPEEDGVELHVNQVGAPPAMVDLDVKITHYDQMQEAWEQVKEEFSASTGLSYEEFLSRIPEELRGDTAFYSLAARDFKNAGQNAAYTLHDYVFECRSEEGVRATITLCSFEEPLKDCYVREDAPEASSVNGVPMTIYHYNDAYMVSFSYQDVYYDIETRNMDLDQLQELLSQLTS